MDSILGCKGENLASFKIKTELWQLGNIASSSNIPFPLSQSRWQNASSPPFRKNFPFVSHLRISVHRKLIKTSKMSWTWHNDGRRSGRLKRPLTGGVRQWGRGAGVGGQRRVLSLPGQTSFDLSVHCFEPQTDRSAGLTLTRDGQLRSGIRGRRAEATTSLLLASASRSFHCFARLEKPPRLYLVWLEDF